jgi:hypothetical protein
MMIRGDFGRYYRSGARAGSCGTTLDAGLGVGLRLREKNRGGEK